MARGITVQNWTILQNVCDGKEKVHDQNIGWSKSVIHCLWKYSNEIWVNRCQEVNKKDPKHLSSLTHMEIMKLIQKYLNNKHSELSITEQQLYLNITRS